MALYTVSPGGTIKSADLNQCVNAINGLQVAQAVGVTSGPTTASTTAVALTDMSVTLTAVGTKFLVFFSVTVQNNTAADSVFITPYLDSGTAGSSSVVFAQGTDWSTVSGVWLFTGLSAASHTVALYWNVDAGTASSNATRRTLTVLNLP